MLIDTHVHLNEERLLENLSLYIDRAKANGVNKMIVVGYDLETSKKAIDIARRYEGIYASIGLHPSELKDIDDNLEWIKELAKDENVIAIGEVGLDYYWDNSYKEKQIDYFIKQINIANELGLPLIIHSRDAIQDTYDCLKKYAKVKGVMHCYSGNYEMAKEFIKIGFFFGIGGVVTFKNSSLGHVVEEIGLDYIISETDAPYMAPTPYRGKMNEPSYIVETVKKIAMIFDKSIEEVEKKIEDNVKELFDI